MAKKSSDIDIATAEENTSITILQAENKKLKKINQVLIQRIESGASNSEDAYATFESAVMLKEKVKERTLKLAQTLNDLEQMNNSLLAAKREAEHANLTKTKFLAAVGHDLLQPMSAARLYMGALKEHDLPADASQTLESLDYSVENLESLVSTLVDISKLDSGVVEPDMTTFNIDTLLANLANEFEQQAKNANLGFRFKPCTVIVHSDLQLLARVLRNLLSNAIRYTDSGDILLGCRRRPEGLLVQVMDTGVGIPEKKLTEIFLEFYRLDKAKLKSNQGLGLGLSIVDKITQMLSIKVYVQSELDRGSVFSVLLPYGSLQQSNRSTLIPYELHSLKHPFKGRYILVIDNEPSICDSMKTLLKGWGCQVITASSVRDLSIREAEQADLLITDYHLDEDENGLEEAMSLQKGIAKFLPVMVVTADRSHELKIKVRQQGYQLLHKPIKPHKLKSILRHLLPFQSEKPT